MKKPVRRIIEDKRRWHHQPTPEEKEQGFKGWYSRGYLPHFDLPGVLQFVTYRLADSVPAAVLREWEQAGELADDQERFRRLESLLDRGHGRCQLRDSRIAELVEANLRFHDGHGYRLIAWVVMPNHVHLLAELWQPLGVVVKQWKSYTATAANRILGTVGERFWQPEYFDRYIRDRDHGLRVVRYIERNPVGAGLVEAPEAWPWSSARFREPGTPAALPAAVGLRALRAPERGPI